jgi:hypothetical protein
MEIDLDDLDVVKKVQVQVCGLDALGIDEIRDSENDEIIEGLSLGFWLEEPLPPVDGEQAPRKATIRSLPDACFDAAMRLKRDEADLEVRSQPAERDGLIYYPFLVNRRYLYRVAVSPFLEDLQRRCLANPRDGGRYSIVSSEIELFRLEDVHVEPIAVGPEFEQEWQTFLSARERCFQSIARVTDIIETCFLTGTDESKVSHLRNAIVHYADTYQRLLTAVYENTNEQVSIEQHLEWLVTLLQLDTLRIHLNRPGHSQECTLVFPTHPMRLLWYLAYSELVSEWLEELLGMPPLQRKSRINASIVRMVEPSNLPAFVPLGKSMAHSFVANISFLYGLAFPVDVDDPDRLISNVARLVGFDPEEFSSITVFPHIVTQELDEYRSLHDYSDCLRLNVLNPGSGGFIRKVGELLLSPTEDLRRLDIITHSLQSPQYPAPGLDHVVRLAYEAGVRRVSHLAPQIQLARRELTEDGLSDIPGGDVHVSLCTDLFRPQLILAEPSERDDSGSFYGLLTHFHSHFSCNDHEIRWLRLVSFHSESRRAEHPRRPLYTTRLIDLHRQFLHLSACVIGWSDCRRNVPGIGLQLDMRQRQLITQIHRQSDWVLSLDRNLGIEYFDSPQDTYLSAEADRYLIDHTPEFIEGIGHRLFVTTGWQEEVRDILRRGLADLDIDPHPDAVANLLNTLKSLSGRLALRLVGNEVRAKEAFVHQPKKLLEVCRSRRAGTGSLSQHPTPGITRQLPGDVDPGSLPSFFGIPGIPDEDGNPCLRCLP